MEYEADYMALYLMKRANYDIHTWSNTIHLLATNEDGVELMEQELLQNSHPLTEDRVDAINMRIKEVEKAFEEKYVTAEVNTYEEVVDYVKSWISVLFT